MSDNKCYICFDTEGVLNKTCINERCTAMTHHPCLQIQSITSKKCGICRSNIIINNNYRNSIKFLFMMCSLILHSCLMFIMLKELKPLNPLNTKFDNITIIIKHTIFNYDITDIIRYCIYSYVYIILACFSLFNYFIHVDILCGNNELIKEYNYKYGEYGTILFFSILEIIFFLICHIIGYSLCVILSYDNCEFITTKTFLLGVIFLFTVFLILLSSCLISRHIFPFY